MVRSKTYIAVPPGATIKEQLEDRGMTQKEFAARMDMSEKHISKLINGEVLLTQDVAQRLEMVLGVPARFWNNLEAIYREKITLAKTENALKAEAEIAKDFPYGEMVKYGWVPPAKKNEEKVIPLRKYFEIVNLANLDEKFIPGIACRRQVVTQKGNFALFAWAQKAKIEARSVETAPIDLKRLEECIPEILAMADIASDELCPRLTEILASCGIALVLLPHIGGSFLHGATFVDRKKIVIGLASESDADKFWFNLFHEIAHVLKGHINSPQALTEADEREADDFACEVLLSNDQSGEPVTRPQN